MKHIPIYGYQFIVIYLELCALATEDHGILKIPKMGEVPYISLMGASASALEKKGIETDKGNINREIKKHNSLVKAIRERISELTSWMQSKL